MVASSFSPIELLSRTFSHDLLLALMRTGLPMKIALAGGRTLSITPRHLLRITSKFDDILSKFCNPWMKMAIFNVSAMTVEILFLGSITQRASLTGGIFPTPK